MLEIQKDIDGQDYFKLIEYAMKHCNRFAIVERKDMMADEKGRMAYVNELVEDIQDSLIEIKEQSSWETNGLVDSMAYVFYYELNEKTKQFLQEKSQSLLSWISPYLPEDLMLYQDDSIWLACNAHEGYFYCQDDLLEYEDFKNLTQSAVRLND